MTTTTESAPLTAAEIQEILARAKFDYLRDRVIPNCYALGAEADLLVLRISGWVEEVEIKTSAADFRREFVEKAEKHSTLQRGKPTWRRDPHTWERLADWSAPEPHTIHRYWFAMPQALAATLLPEIPTYAGLLSVTRYGRLGRVEEYRRAPILKPSRKITDAERHTLLESIYYRYWKLKLKQER